jgi:hypothetical protein
MKTPPGMRSAWHFQRGLSLRRRLTHVKHRQQKKDKKPLTCGNTVPEVGLELHSRPCEQWEVAKTRGIRASRRAIRRSPRRNVRTMSTLP